MSDQRLGKSRKVSLARGRDPRERSAHGALTQNMLGAGLMLDGADRIALNISPESPLYTNEKGETDMRVGDGLEVAPGSPNTLKMLPAKRPRAQDVVGLDAAIEAKATPIAVEKAGKSVAFRVGTVTTTILDTAVVVTFASAMPHGSYEVFIQPKAGVAVQLWPSAIGPSGFTLNLSAGVAATFAYLAIGVP